MESPLRFSRLAHADFRPIRTIPDVSRSRLSLSRVFRPFSFSLQQSSMHLTRPEECKECNTVETGTTEIFDLFCHEYNVHSFQLHFAICLSLSLFHSFSLSLSLFLFLSSLKLLYIYMFLVCFKDKVVRGQYIFYKVKECKLIVCTCFQKCLISNILVLFLFYLNINLVTLFGTFAKTLYNACFLH